MEVTAVEYLFEQINDALIDFTEGKITALIYGIRVTEYKRLAKQMEKEQIIDAHNAGKNILPPNESGEQYYNETYGKAN